MNVAAGLLAALFSVLVPQKMWYTPSQAILVDNKGTAAVTLVLTDFSGKALPATGSAQVDAGKSADVKSVFPQTAKPGTYVLYAVAGAAPAGAGAPKAFVGTPLVIETLKEEGGDGPMVVHVVPLQFMKMTTVAGPMTMIFYYDSAPHTVDSFLQLSEGGYFDGLTFHRIAKDFVIQGGDPIGNGAGGPGYHLDAEFNDRPHTEGTLSMARARDLNSAGSQFFVCLNYENTKQHDKQYTVFGKVVEGFDTTVKKIAATPCNGETPTTPQTIEKAEVVNVTAENDPYAGVMGGK